MKSLQWIAPKNVWQHVPTALTVVMLSQFLTESVHLEILKICNLQVTTSKKNCQKPKSSGFTGEQLMVSVLMLNSEDEDMKITQAAQISDLSDLSDATTTTSNLLALDSCSGTSLRTSNYIVEAFDV